MLYFEFHKIRNYNKINNQKRSIKVSSYIVKQPLTVDDCLNIYRYNRTLIKHRLHKSQLSNNTQYMITIKESIHYSIYTNIIIVHPCTDPLLLSLIHTYIYIFLIFMHIGPTLPNPPVDLTITAKHAQEVIVEWFVTKISYTPEIYTVQYGIEEDELVYFSSINSSDDITLTGQMFNLKLTGLRGNTKYYYRLLTTNSFASVVSSTKTFTTPQHCKFLTTKLINYT